jgi:hypothetical protein
MTKISSNWTCRVSYLPGVSADKVLPQLDGRQFWGDPDRLRFESRQLGTFGEIEHWHLLNTYKHTHCWRPNFDRYEDTDSSE